MAETTETRLAEIEAALLKLAEMLEQTHMQAGEMLADPMRPLRERLAAAPRRA